MRSPLLHATRLLAVSTLILSLSTTYAQEAQPKGKAVTTYGNVTIEKFDRLKGSFDLSGLLITGKETIITVPYPRSRATLKIHADTITTKRTKSDYFATTELVAHVRFKIMQKLASGKERILEGTSERATFRRDNEQVKLSGNVVATVTDDENLMEPAKLQAEHLTVDIHSVPYRYSLVGGQGSNQIRLITRPKTPKNPDPKKKPESPKHITISGYHTASFQASEQSVFEGEGTTIEFSEQDGKLTATLAAPYIKTEMLGENGSLSGAEMRGGIHYTLHLVHPETKTEEVLLGTAKHGTYSFLKNNLVIEGGIQATLNAPDALMEPAKIRVEKLTLHTITPTRYQLEADPQTALFQFTPKQKEQPKPKPSETPTETTSPALPKASFKLGTVRITHFTSGNFEEDKTADFTGNRLLFETVDNASGSIARFRTRTMHAEIGKNNVITQVTAAGNVEYLVQQTPLPDKTKPNEKPVAQLISGNAYKVTLTHTAKQDSLDIAGPFRTELVLPDQLLEPGLITGAQGDNINIVLVDGSYGFDITTPNQTSFVRLLPREIAEPEDKPKADAPLPKGKNKS